MRDETFASATIGKRCKRIQQGKNKTHNSIEVLQIARAGNKVATEITRLRQQNL